MMREKSSSSLPWTLWALALVFFVASTAYGDSLIGVNQYSFEGEAHQLVVIDPATGALLGGHDITLAGEFIQQPTALAADPTTGVLYALLTVRMYEDRARLVTIDPVTGIATEVGNTDQRLRSLTFKPDGTLLGITTPYDWYATPVRFFTIDKTTGVATQVCERVGIDDNVIAYNADDSQLYYALGSGTAKAFETLNESTCAETNIGYTGGGTGPVTALLYDTSAGTFLAADDGWLATITPGGVVSTIGELAFPDDATATIRGFAWTTESFTFGDVATNGSFSPSTIPPGGPTTLTLNAVNNGTDPLTGVIVTVGGHPLTMTGYSGDATCVASAGGGCVCTFGDLAGNATETVQVYFTADISSDSSRSDIPMLVRANEYDTHPKDNRSWFSIYRGDEVCTGGFFLTSELLSGDPTPPPGYSGSWTFRITAQNCTGGALEGVKIQGGTNGWGHYVGLVASSGTTSIKTNKRAEVVTWMLDLENGAEATLDVTLSGSISRRSVCSPDVSMPVFGSIKYLSGIWSATHNAFGEVEADRVAIVVECERP